VEVLCGLQHVAVVRVDLLEAMFFGAGQVERVTRSDEDRARKIEDGFAGLLQQFRGHTKPPPHTVLLIFFEVSQDHRQLSPSHVALSDVSLEDRGKLQPRRFTGSEAVGAIRYLADSIRAWLIEVALNDVRGANAMKPPATKATAAPTRRSAPSHC
jgi:hypothetical protein